MRRSVLAIAPLVLLLGFRCHDEEIRALEAEKAALLESTQPKSAFWAAVERKGSALKKQKLLASERPAILAKTDAAKGELAGFEANLAELRKRNAAALEDVHAAEAKATAAEERLAQVRHTLEQFDQRRRAEGHS
jgi:hypothetical protein